MQTFNLDINDITFTFIRVPYGRGDLWYHVSYKMDDKVFTFRMTVVETTNWGMFDVNENWVLQQQHEFNKAIKAFERGIYSAKENIGQQIKAAS